MHAKADIEREAGDLLPCPFCGGEADHAIGYRGDHGFAVRCQRLYCRAAIGGHPTKQRAIEMWNTRALTTPAS